MPPIRQRGSDRVGLMSAAPSAAHRIGTPANERSAVTSVSIARLEKIGAGMRLSTTSKRPLGRGRKTSVATRLA